MPKLIDHPPGSDTPATPSTDRNSVTHHEVAGWGGVPGDCGVECACGVSFDGFDTIAEASTLLAQHVDDHTVAHPAWCSPEQCWAYPAGEDEPEPSKKPRPGGFHQSAPVRVDTLGGHGLALRMVQDHGAGDAPEVELSPNGYSPELPQVLHLSLAQCDELRDAIDTLLSGHGRPLDDAIMAAFRAGRAVERQRVQSIVGGGERQAYASGYVDGLRDRLSKRAAKRAAK